MININLFPRLVEPKPTKANDGLQDLNSSTVLPSSNLPSSPVTGTPSNNIQYAVFCSSKQARV